MGQEALLDELMTHAAFRQPCDKTNTAALVTFLAALAIRATGQEPYRRAPSYGCRDASEVLNLRAATREIGQPVRIAVFDQDGGMSGGVDRIGIILDRSRAVKWTCISAGDIKRGRLHEFDAVVFPGGRGSAQAAALGVEGREAVRDFVQRGGGYVGICAGAFLATAGSEWSLALVKVEALSDHREIPGVGLRSMAEREVGTVVVELTNDGQLVFGHRGERLVAQYTGGPIFVRSEPDRDADYATLASFRTELCKFEAQKGTMIDSPAVVAARYGFGRVILFSPHPELSADLEPLLVPSILATTGETRD